MQKKQAGFTLIEIAIVLVIVGLLLGGVLKGQELITGSKVKSLTNDLKATQAMVFTYQDRFRLLPGDDNQAATRFPVGGADPAATNGNGNGAIGDGKFDDAAVESKLFWQHVRRANLATGSAGNPATAANLYLPTHAFGGVIGVSSTLNVVGLPGTMSVCANNVSGQYVMRVDTSIDDAQTNTGTLRTRLNIASGANTNTNGNAIATATVSAANNVNTAYTICYGF